MEFKVHFKNGKLVLHKGSSTVLWGVLTIRGPHPNKKLEPLGSVWNSESTREGIKLLRKIISHV